MHYMVSYSSDDGSEIRLVQSQRMIKFISFEYHISPAFRSFPPTWRGEENSGPHMKSQKFCV